MKTKFFGGLVKFLRASLAFYMLYWALEHFSQPAYFQSLHKTIYENILVYVFKVLSIDPPGIQTFDGYWPVIGKITGLVEVLIAVLYWKNQGFGTALTFLWSLTCMVVANFDIMSKTLKLLSLMDVDTVNLPIGVFLVLLLSSQYLEKGYIAIKGWLKNIVEYIWKFIFSKGKKESNSTSQSKQQKKIDNDSKKNQAKNLSKKTKRASQQTK